MFFFFGGGGEKTTQEEYWALLRAGRPKSGCSSWSQWECHCTQKMAPLKFIDMIWMMNILGGGFRLRYSTFYFHTYLGKISHLIILTHIFQMSFAFFCCHLRYAGFGHINQKLSPYCSRGSSRKQYSHFFMRKLRGSAFCRNLSLCLLYTFLMNNI